jgi:hypothetical protein
MEISATPDPHCGDISAWQNTEAGLALAKSWENLRSDGIRIGPEKAAQ